MSLVDLWDGNNRQHDEKKNMAEDEIASEHSKLRDLAKEFTSGLRHRMPSHGIPFTSPESDVRRVVLEFSCQSQGDDELVDKSLNGSGSDHAKQGLGEYKTFQEEHDFENNDEHNDGHTVGDGGED